MERCFAPKNDYDPALMDSRMPKMDGLEATRRVGRKWYNSQRYVHCGFRKRQAIAEKNGGIRMPCPASRQGFADTEGGLRFRRESLIDSGGFGCELLGLLVPKEWRFSGAVNWDFSKIPPKAAASFTASSPGGGLVAEQFPQAEFFWTEDPTLGYAYSQTGMQSMQPFGAADFLRRLFLPNVRSRVGDPRILSEQPLPELSRHTLDVLNAQMTLFGSISPFQTPFEPRADAAKAVVEYTIDGEVVREDLTASLSYMTSYIPSMFASLSVVSWSANVFGFRAPSGRMDAAAPLFRVVHQSRAENPQWHTNYIRLAATTARDRIRMQQQAFAAMQRVRQTLNETSDIIARGYEERSRAMDRVFDDYSRSVRGTELYADPCAGRTVELPNGYREVWTDGTDYILSDNANFNPNTESLRSWRRMEAAKG